MEKKFEYSPEDIHTIVKSLCLEDELDGTLSTIFSAFIDGRMESDFFYGSKRVCEILETYKTQISCLFALNRLPSLESRDIQKHIPDLNKVFDGLQNIELGYYEEERCYIKLTKADGLTKYTYNGSLVDMYTHVVDMFGDRIAYINDFLDKLEGIIKLHSNKGDYASFDMYIYLSQSGCLKMSIEKNMLFSDDGLFSLDKIITSDTSVIIGILKHIGNYNNEFVVKDVLVDKFSD